MPTHMAQLRSSRLHGGTGPLEQRRKPSEHLAAISQRSRSAPCQTKEGRAPRAVAHPFRLSLERERAPYGAACSSPASRTPVVFDGTPIEYSQLIFTARRRAPLACARPQPAAALVAPASHASPYVPDGATTSRCQLLVTIPRLMTSFVEGIGKVRWLRAMAAARDGSRPRVPSPPPS